RLLNERGEESEEFQSALAAMLAEFGQTTDMWRRDAPSWEEDPAVPLAIVREYARLPEGQGPRDSAERQRLRREALEAELISEAPELLDKLRAGQQFLPCAEDHNFLCDQRTAAASRRRWLNI